MWYVVPFVCICGMRYEMLMMLTIMMMLISNMFMMVMMMTFLILMKLVVMGLFECPRPLVARPLSHDSGWACWKLC